jgi:hypothetical protein
MSSDHTYNQAIKKLEITPVDKQTGLKAETWTKAKDIRKLRQYFDIVDFPLVANLENAKQAAVRFELNTGSACRILNWRNLQTILNRTDYNELGSSGFGVPQIVVNSVETASSYILAGIKEYNGRPTVTTKQDAYYYSLNSFPWYTGEKIGPTLKLYVYSNTIYFAIDLIIRLRLELNSIRLPSTLTDEDESLAYAYTTRNGFTIAMPAAWGTAFP